jgi:O-antigen ligase
VGADADRRRVARPSRRSVRRLTLASNPSLVVMPLAVGCAALLSWRAVATPELVLIAVAALLYVAFSIWSLVGGLAVFIVLTFPEQLPGFAGVATLAKPAGLVLAFSWLLLQVQRRDAAFLPRDQPLLAMVGTAFIVWAAGSVLWATDVAEVVVSLTRLVQVAVLFLIVHSAVRSTRDLLVLGWAYLVGALFTAVYSMATGGYGDGGRLAGIFDSNFFAAQLVAAMAIGFFMVAAMQRWSVRILLFAMLATYAVAFALTQSRGGLAALGVGLLALVVYAGRWRPQAVVVALLAVGLGIAYYGSFAADDVRERFTNLSAEGSSGRVDEWQIAAEIIRDRPLTGVGMGNFTVVEPSYALNRDVNLLRPEYALELQLETHNTYLELASELGLIGVVLFAALVGMSLFTALRGVRRFKQAQDAAGEAITRGLVVATLGILTAYVFLSGIYEKQLWILLGTLVAADFVATRLHRTGDDVDLETRSVPIPQAPAVQLRPL